MIACDAEEPEYSDRCRKFLTGWRSRGSYRPAVRLEAESFAVVLMVVVSLEPDFPFMDRCGMATSTRKIAAKLWKANSPKAIRPGWSGALRRRKSGPARAVGGAGHGGADLPGRIEAGLR